MSDAPEGESAPVVKRPRYVRALLEGTVLACVWLIATLLIAAILPTRLPPIDPQMLERERQGARSWEQVEKVHKEQMERLRREASDPVH